MELKSKVAIVTYGSRGIGRAIARELAQAGATVVVSYLRRGKGAESIAAEIGGHAFRADLRTATGCASIVAFAKSLGELAIVVNNPGVPGPAPALLDSDSQAAIAMCREALPDMLRRQRGAIINVTQTANDDESGGSATLIGLTRSIAREAARANVRVNAVVPGYIEEDGIDTPSAPLGRGGCPEDVAHVVRFLCTATYVVGQTISVDGGLSVADPAQRRPSPVTSRNGPKEEPEQNGVRGRYRAAAYAR